MAQSLALKYRPQVFADLTEQSSIVRILTNQIETGTIKHGYLFAGGAGTGKTTSARIFANMINHGSGTPIELDAASNNSVEDIRRLCEDAQTQSLDSEYKVFILDEAHSLSNQAWQAMLKTLEEPPAKSIFIFCTTDPQKIPNTILSRVQRYNFQRISQDGIMNRLFYILEQESEIEKCDWEATAIEYIAKIADGGMRDAITLMDKCLSYDRNLTVTNVIKALGIADYETMANLTDAVIYNKAENVIELISSVHASGMDLKQFIKNYFEFVLDLNIYRVTGDLSLTKLPNTITVDGKDMKLDEVGCVRAESDLISKLLDFTLKLLSSIKWEQNPKPVIIANFMIFME